MEQNHSNHLIWPLMVCVLWSVFLGCEKEQATSGNIPPVPESFQFMDIGANTIIDADARHRLKESLGAYAINSRTEIDLNLKYESFLKTYYPDLAKLNRRLNVNAVVLKEYPATKLTFRNTQEGKTGFDYVELIYGHASRCPLLIKMIAQEEDIPEFLKSVEDKYGPPEKIPTSGGKSWSLSWHKKGDVFVIARLLGRDDQPEYYMMIVFTNRLKRLLARSSEDKQQDGKQAGRIF